MTAFWIAVYSAVTLVVTVAVASSIRRRAAASSYPQERWALRTGLVIGVLAVGTVGTVEAAFLGFHPIALVPTAIFGALGFGFGAAVGSLGAFVFRR